MQESSCSWIPQLPCIHYIIGESIYTYLLSELETSCMKTMHVLIRTRSSSMMDVHKRCVQVDFFLDSVFNKETTELYTK